MNNSYFTEHIGFLGEIFGNGWEASITYLSFAGAGGQVLEARRHVWRDSDTEAWALLPGDLEKGWGSSRVPLMSPASVRVQQLEKAISDLKFSLIPTGPPWEESAPSVSRCSLEKRKQGGQKASHHQFQNEVKPKTK